MTPACQMFIFMKIKALGCESPHKKPVGELLRTLFSLFCYLSARLQLQRACNSGTKKRKCSQGSINLQSFLQNLETVSENEVCQYSKQTHSCSKE